MKAVRNRHCNAELTGDGCKPLPARRMEYRNIGGNPHAKPLVVFSSWWELTDEEMHALSRAALEGRPTIRLDIFADRHPPVTLMADNLTPEEIGAMENAGDEVVLPNAITPAGGEWPRK
ncbi:MAG: hypothetical protein OXU22_00425 [Gammaproteobacteria bacterium]|nr:hypothetical protein [Gammaproteobacteria bacterium]